MGPKRCLLLLGPSAAMRASWKLVSGAVSSIVDNESSDYDAAGILVTALIADNFVLNGRQ